MAMLLVSEELIRDEPRVLPVLRAYFSSMMEVDCTYPKTRQFKANMPGLPEDDTQLAVIMQADEQGRPYVASVDF